MVWNFVSGEWGARFTHTNIAANCTAHFDALTKTEYFVYGIRVPEGILSNIILPNISPDESPVSASEWQTTFCYFFILKPNQTSGSIV